MTNEQEKIIRNALSPWRFSLFMLWKLPGAWFMGARMSVLTLERAKVLLPYRWRSQNPFRSIYFAAQCAAGELSTGMLVLLAIGGRANVSMLVTGAEARFLKKANQTLRFVCEDGAAINESIRRAIESGEPQIFEAHTTGYLPDGSVACEMKFTWAFKRK